MKKLTRGALAAFAFVALTGFSGPHDEPGVPGTPNCEGQTMAYLAQAGKNADVQEARGIGQLAQYAGLSVKELREIVIAYCAGS